MAGSPAGFWVKTIEGYRAFRPLPPPPTLTWTPSLAFALSSAAELVGRLAAEGARLPNPHVLIRPFVRREAVSSSRIEGTQATLGELLSNEAGIAVDRSPQDLREVGNYVAALEHGLARLPNLPLSLRLVRELHARLMTGVRGSQATPGAFRRTQNWIGKPGCALAQASYVPPPPEDLLECLGQWERFLHDRTLPPLVHAALAHYQFEAIHPFIDGNGRVGRLLITLELCERNVLPTPLLHLSSFFEATRDDYYAGLRAVHEHNDWAGWLEYFLNGVARQAEDAIDRASRINAHIDGWKAALASTPDTKVARRLVDQLAANPFTTITHAARRLDVAFNTAARAVDQCVQRGILRQNRTALRDRVYCAKDLLNILEEPARIAPISNERQIQAARAAPRSTPRGR